MPIELSGQAECPHCREVVNVNLVSYPAGEHFAFADHWSPGWRQAMKAADAAVTQRTVMFLCVGSRARVPGVAALDASHEPE